MKTIKIIITLLILLSNLVLAEDISYFVELKLDHATDELTLMDLSLIEDGNTYSDIGLYTYNVELFAFDETLLHNYSIYVDPPIKEYLPIDDDSTAPIVGDYYLITLTMPYNNKGKEIVITNLETEEKFVIDVSDYASCNEDEVCDLSEDERSCPEDCVIEKLEIKPELEEEVEEKITKEIEEEAKKPTKTLFITIGTVLFLVIIVAVIIKRKRKLYK